MNLHYKHLFILALCLAASVASSQSIPPYKNPKLPINERVNDLLNRMTLEEKFFQLFMIPGDLDNREPGQYEHGIFGLQVSAQSQGSGDTQQMLKYNTNEDALALARKINTIQKFFVEKTRLGIPIIAFDEALHGLVREGATVFPQSIALAATFDTTLMRQVSGVIAEEAKVRGIRQVLSPVINIASDVRWGRVEETYGEDPFLTSAMGVAYVSPLERSGIITTPKHFIANVGDGGRDSYPIHLSDRLLEEIYFPPFKACLSQGGSRSIMTSYNSLNGEPCTSNHWLLMDKLKKEWGFQGVVVSDASATGGSIVLHNTAPDFPTAGQQAINGGLDVIFQTQYKHYQLFWPGFTNGGISNVRLDDAVARVLRAKFELGLFEHPYVSEDLLKTMSSLSKHQDIARKASQESIVLLKNKNNTLPLKEGIKTIAIIGREAVDARLGGYSGPGNNTISILKGIQQRAGKSTRILYSEGCGIRERPWDVIATQYLYNERQSGLQAEYFDNIALTGKPVATKQVSTVDFSWTLSSPDPAVQSNNYSARWTGKIKSPQSGTFKIGLDGNDGFRLYINNQLLIDQWMKQSYHTSLVDFYFDKDRAYDVRVEYFEAVGNGHIRLIWNAAINEVAEQAKMERAVEAVQQSDVAIVVVGIHEGEFQDRGLLSLPGRQEELVKRAAATGKPVMVVLVGGSAIAMNNWIDSVNGIVDVWYPGEQGGAAIASVLFGDYNPAGRLPVTFPLHEGQVPLVYNHKPTGRGDDYYNLSGLPLFPFGFGLSYTTFDYTAIRVDKSTITKEQSAIVTVTVRNTGTRAGEEVVQLYIRDVLASVARPVMELKGFKRIHLDAGESKDVSFSVGPEQLIMLNDKMEQVVEPGEFQLMVGGSSRDIRRKQMLLVK